MTTIQVNFVLIPSKIDSPELSLLNFLPLIHHHSHFLTTTLDFSTFFTWCILHGGRTFFTARLFLNIHAFIWYILA